MNNLTLKGAYFTAKYIRPLRRPWHKVRTHISRPTANLHPVDRLRRYSLTASSDKSEPRIYKVNKWTVM